MVPNRQNVLVVSAAAVVAAAVATADAFAAAAVARGAVKPIADVAAQRAAKPIVVDDDVDDLFRRVCRERCHGLHNPVEPRRRAPDRRRASDRRLAALHLWSGHGCRRHLRSSSSSPRPESGLPPVHQGQCLSSIKTYFFNIEFRGKTIQDAAINFLFGRAYVVLVQLHYQSLCSSNVVPR